MKSWLVAMITIVALCGFSNQVMAQPGASVDVVYTSGGGIDYSGSYQYDSPKYYWMDAGGGDYVEIKWNSGLMTPAWEFYLYESDGTITVFNTNTAATELVPQNGWRDDSMSGTDNLATFSGSGTEDNVILSTTTVNVVFSDGTNDLGGEYSYDTTDGTGRPSYYLDVNNATGGWAIISWNDTESRWEFWLDTGNPVSDKLYATSSETAMLVPQDGWIAEGTYDVPAFTGTGTYFDVTTTEVIVMGSTTGYDGTYAYAGEMNGKPTYQNTEVAMGIVGFAWDGTKWVFAHLFDDMGTTIIDFVMDENTATTALVPTNGWADVAGEGLGSVSGSGTEDNAVVISIDVVYPDMNATGQYIWYEDYNARPSYSYNDGAGSVFTVRWDGTGKWELVLTNMTGTFVLNTAAFDISDVPNYGWVDDAGAGLATFSGDNTVDPVQISDDFNTYSLQYNGDKNGKPSFIGESAGMMGGKNVHEIEWTGTEWKYILTQGFDAPKDMNTNTGDGMMVPQNGWVDVSSWGVVFNFSGYYTVNNTPTAIEDVMPGFEMGIYPNPATDFVIVNLNELATLTVYGTTGSVVMVKELNVGENRVELASLANGIYMFAVEVNGETEVVKVIKK